MHFNIEALECRKKKWDSGLIPIRKVGEGRGGGKSLSPEKESLGKKISTGVHVLLENGLYRAPGKKGNHESTDSPKGGCVLASLL